MKYKSVEYSALVNLGDYNNEKIGLVAQVEEGETVEDVVKALREKVKELAFPNLNKLHETIYQGEKQLRELERKLKIAAESWNSTADFLRAQGLKPDAPAMPQFSNLLPEVKEEVVNAELDNIF